MESYAIEVYEEIEEKNPSAIKYSLLTDSDIANYSGNTATLLSAFDAIINCLTIRLKSVNHFIEQQVPFYLRGLYYILPICIPLIPYARHRCSNTIELYDPDALELIGILQENDKDFEEHLLENPEEKKRILEILTSYLRYEKNQPFNIVINLIMLTLRTAQGFLIYAKGFNLLTQEKHDVLSDWTTLISTIVDITFLALRLLHNNFQKYHFSDSKKEHIKSHLLHETFFKIKNRKKTNADTINTRKLTMMHDG